MWTLKTINFIILNLTVNLPHYSILIHIIKTLWNLENIDRLIVRFETLGDE